MSEINWDAIAETMKIAVNHQIDTLIGDAKAGHFNVNKVEPTPETPPPPPPPSDDAPGTNPYASNSGIEATDNPFVGPVKAPANTEVEKVVDMLEQSNLATPHEKGLLVVAKAITQQGKKYGWGATGPDRWDCSGLSQWAYRTALGIEIGRTTYDQIKGGREVKFSDAIDGDLIFSNFGERGPEHVSINMAGPDNVVEAGDPVGIYKWGNRGRVVVKRYT